MEQEPNDVMILSAINQGTKEFTEISTKTKIGLQEVLNIIERLASKDFIKFIFEKKGFLGSIKKETTLTDKGKKELEEKEFALKQNWNQMLNLWKTNDKQKLQQCMDENRLILPSMMFLEIIDMTVFSKMMGFLGLGMTNFIPEQYTSGGHEIGSSDESVGFGGLFKSIIKQGFRNGGGPNEGGFGL